MGERQQVIEAGNDDAGMRLGTVIADYAALGGHMDYVRPLSSIRDSAELRPMLVPGRRA